MREADGKLRHQHCKNQNGRERGRRLRTVLALPSRSLHLEAGPSIGCSQGHGVWHDGGRSPQPARVTAEPGARRRPLPARVTLAAGARSRRAYHEPAAGHGGGRSLQPARAGHGGARNPQRAPGGNREQGGDAILSADGWIGPGHASVGGAAGKESWEGRRRDWRAELDAVRERVRRAGMEKGAVKKNRDLWQKYFP